MGAAHDGTGLARIPQPQRPCCYLFLDHLDLNGSRNHLFLDGKHECRTSVADIFECWRIGDFGRSRTLFLHARILDYHWHLPNSLPLRCKWLNFTSYSVQRKRTSVLACFSACSWVL